MKKYIIITGSPRKDGNSDKIAQQLEAQCKDAGCEAEIFRIEDKKIGSCQACEYCKAHDGCIQKDDASSLIEELKKCAGAVFVAPIYFGNVPGTCKVLTDRFYSMFNPAKGMAAPDPAKKLGIVLTCGGSPEEAVRPAGEFINTCFALAGFGDHKTLVFPGENPKDAFAGNADYQKQIEELGKWLAE